jgi:undecaprenyl pyrophosphate phosphatase UppP
LNADVLAIAAAVHAAIIGKTEMLPVKQPGDMRVFARFMSYPAREGKSYAIAIYLDPRT